MATAAECHDSIRKLQEAVGSVLLGKAEIIDRAIVALLARGHILIEDVPGVGKTLLARALARSLDCTFHRIQFTPDLLPSDIIGSSIYNAQEGTFHFKRGPLFAHVVLADEINRTSPRTQSALLEAMNEGQVSVDGKTYDLGPPFIVLATQNPFEFEGTYPLPESQLDRFLLRLEIGYPPREWEHQLLADHRAGEPIDRMKSSLSIDELIALQDAAREVAVERTISDYILDIIHATREHADLHVGASTRGALMLYRGAQSLALVRGRKYVIPDDVKELAAPVLAHRIIGRSVVPGNARQASVDVIDSILSRLPVPG